MYRPKSKGHRARKPKRPPVSFVPMGRRMARQFEKSLLSWPDHATVGGKMPERLEVVE